MTEFASFSEASRLFADNHALIRRMEETYNLEFDAFLVALAESLTAVLHPIAIAMKPEVKFQSRVWVHCWIDILGIAQEFTPFICFQRTTEIVSQGTFRWYIATMKYASDDIQKRILLALWDENLPSLGLEESQEDFAEATLVINHSEPVESVVKVFAPVLWRLHDYLTILPV